MTVVGVVADLLDRSRLEGVVDEFVATPAAVPESGVDVVVVDLSRPGVLEALGQLSAAGVIVVGFGSHVDTALLAAARAAGCTAVLPRSRFFADPDAAIASARHAARD